MNNTNIQHLTANAYTFSSKEMYQMSTTTYFYVSFMIQYYSVFDVGKLMHWFKDKCKWNVSGGIIASTTKGNE